MGNTAKNILEKVGGTPPVEISTLDALKETPGERNAAEREMRIDYIYVSPGVRVLDYATVGDSRKGKKLYPSDHFPIVSTLEVT